MHAAADLFRLHLAAYNLSLVSRDTHAKKFDGTNIFTASASDVDRAVREAGLDPSSTSDQVSLEAAKLLVEPTRRFLEEHAGPPIDRVQLVFIDEILATDSPLRPHLGDPVGLTISPFLSEEAEGAELAALLGTNNFVPTIFLASGSLSRLTEAQRAEVMLHEFGHAFGLDHENASRTPMAVLGQVPCVSPFGAEQLDKIDLALSAIAP